MAGRLRVSRLPRILDRYRKWDIVLDGEIAGFVANGGDQTTGPLLVRASARGKSPQAVSRTGGSPV